MSRIFVMLGALLISASAVAQAADEVKCQLSSNDFSSRMTEIEELFIGNDKVRELEDGYEFRFPAEKEWAVKLLTFIQSERQCCSFFQFELAFEAEEGPVWLRVRGPEAAKAFLKTLLSDANEFPDESSAP